MNTNTHNRAHKDDTDMDVIQQIAERQSVSRIVSICMALSNHREFRARAKTSHGGSVRFGNTEVFTLMLCSEHVGEAAIRIVVDRLAHVLNVPIEKIQRWLETGFQILQIEEKSMRRNDDRLETYVTVKICNPSEADSFIHQIIRWERALP